MIHPSSPNPLSSKNGAQRPLWWPFAQSCIDRWRELIRLRAIERELAATEARTKFDDGDAFDALPDWDNDAASAPPLPRTEPKLLSRLSQLPQIRHLPDEEWAAIVAAGGDPYATDAEGRNRPETALNLPDLLLLIRLAATLGSETAMDDLLAPEAITIIAGLEPAMGLGRLLTGTLLPADWTTSPLPLMLSTPCLLLPNQAPDKGTLRQVLFSGAPLLLPTKRTEDIPPVLADAPHVRSFELAPLSADILVALLCASHSATGRIDEAATRAALPDDPVLTGLSPDQLALALRARTAAKVAQRLADLTRSSPAPATTGKAPDLAAIRGTTPAHQAAHNIMGDLIAWRDEGLAWSEVTRSLLIHGQPGTGKTFLARQMARAAGVELVEGSFAGWQAAGHLGHMLAAMKDTFDEAIKQAPCILFVDEIDAVGSRFGRDPHGLNYRRQVVNGFLQQIDRLRETPGVILVGACNNVASIDPAVTRPGRFDEIVKMPLPGRSDIENILAKGVSDALDPSEQQELATEAVGQTPARIDAAIRAAKSAARRTESPLTVGLIRDHLGLSETDSNLLRRIAVHEAGHAVAASLFSPGSVTRVTVAPTGGLTQRTETLMHQTIEEIEQELVTLMAGRAAERMIIGSISGGAGGDETSDLALATSLVLQLDRQFGLGQNGSAWLGQADMHRLTDSEKQRIRAKLTEAERRARYLLEPHKEHLTALAERLVETRELKGEKLHQLLADLEEVKFLKP